MEVGMGVGIYDEAVSNKISNLIGTDGVMILKPSETSRLWKITDDKNNDKPLTLPLISISRYPDITLQTTGNKPMTKFGFTLDKSPVTEDVVTKVKTSKGETLKLNAIPIDISYQLDIYTRHFNEADNYLREFVFSLMNHPKLEVELNINGIKTTHTCSIELMSTVSDNSDISERLISGQFTRFTLDFRINGAYLWSLPSLKGYEISEDSVVDVTFGDKLSAEED